MSFKNGHFLLVVCFTVDMLMVSGVTIPPAITQKRPNEGGQLEEVVEQLSQQVNSLSAQLTQQARLCNAEVAALKIRTGKSLTCCRVLTDRL